MADARKQSPDISNDVRVRGKNYGLENSDRWILFLGLGSLSLGQAVILSTFGPIARDVGLMEYDVGIIISVSALIAGLVAPWWGRRSDVVGHKRIFLIAVVGNFFAMIAFTFLLKLGKQGDVVGSSLFLSLLCVRFFYAVTASAGLPAASGFIGLNTSANMRTKAMTVTGTAFSLGSLMGAVLTFVVAGVFGACAPLWVAGGVIFIISIIIVLNWLGPPMQTEQTPVLQYIHRGKQPKFYKYAGLLGISAMAFTAMGIIQQVIPFYVQDTFKLGTMLSVQKVGLLSTVLAVATLVALQMVARFQFRPILTLVFGCLIMLLGAVILSFSPSITILIMVYMLMGAGGGFVLPSLQALLSLIASSTDQALVSGYLSSSTMVGYVVGPVLGGSLYSMVPEIVFVVPLLLICVATLIAIYMLYINKNLSVLSM